jgi:multiple sugar transport system ATP-binding protein
LSGGQRQRVALGRAIVRDPKVFLFDEPLSNLDAALRVSTRGEIAALHRRLGATMVYVTHDQVEAMTMGTRICIMNKGRVVQVGAPLDVYRNPVNTFVAAFLGNPPMNLLPAVVVEGGDGRRLKVGETVVAIPIDRVMPLAPGSAVTLGIRPETVTATSQTSATVAALMAETVQVERLGAETLVVSSITGMDARLIARISGDEPVAVGEKRPLYADLATAHVFDASGNALRATLHSR